MNNNVSAKLYVFTAKLFNKYAQAKLLQLSDGELAVLFGELHNILQNNGNVNDLFKFATYLYNEGEVKQYLSKVDVVLSYRKDVNDLPHSS